MYHFGPSWKQTSFCLEGRLPRSSGQGAQSVLLRKICDFYDNWGTPNIDPQKEGLPDNKDPSKPHICRDQSMCNSKSECMLPHAMRVRLHLAGETIGGLFKSDCSSV